ncbi:hypothetical protein Tco_1554056 [Tanacetum coccineum]
MPCRSTLVKGLGAVCKKLSPSAPAGRPFRWVLLPSVYEDYWIGWGLPTQYLYELLEGLVHPTRYDVDTENVRNVIVNGNRVGYSYKEFFACNPKEYDGKGDVEFLIRWNEIMKYFMMIQEFCPSHEMQKLESELWNHAMVGAGHAAYTNRFHELARLVPHLVTPESRMIESFSALTDEAVRNGSIKRVEKRGNVGEPSKDRSGRDDNKRTRTRNSFATTINPVGRENTGHVISVGAEEACQDPNIVTGLEPSDLGFRYEIEIASGQLVEIDKVIKGCKLEIEGHVFDIDLIPFGHGSFDVIIGSKTSDEGSEMCFEGSKAYLKGAKYVLEGSEIYSDKTWNYLVPDVRDGWLQNLQEGNALFGFQDLCLRQELLEYMCVHDNDASENSQPSWGKMCTSGT